MIHCWKAPHIVKGIMTHLPLLNEWRLRQASTGGTDSSDYCYRVWIHHLSTLSEYGFKIKGAQIGELGPGDSIGTGLAALLSGANRYAGLDVVPYSARADLEKIFRGLVEKFSAKEPVPDVSNFPDQAIDWAGFNKKVEKITRELRNGLNGSQFISYHAPWTSPDVIAANSLDLVFSHCVLEYVDPLSKTYRTMYEWLRPGGYCSHHIAMNANHLSPFWNGHWAYSDWEWRLLRGRRFTVLNREPLSTHIKCAGEAGFEILHVRSTYGHGGLDRAALSPRFQSLDAEDLKTRGALLILRKPS